jgi:hypothetical protein
LDSVSFPPATGRCMYWQTPSSYMPDNGEFTVLYTTWCRSWCLIHPECANGNGSWVSCRLINWALKANTANGPVSYAVCMLKHHYYHSWLHRECGNKHNHHE